MPKFWFAESDPFAPINYRYKVNKRLFSKKSPYQHVKVFEHDFFGRIMTIDDVVQLADRDEFFYHEMLAHVPLHMHPAPKKVLIIGGGDGGTLREALKHPTVEKAVLIDIDALVIETSKRFFPQVAVAFKSPRATVLNMDGAKYMRETGERFDAVLVDSTDPVGPAKTLSTQDFFKTAANVLTPNGLFAMQTESLHYHIVFINQVQGYLGKVFPSVGLYAAPLATYAGNYWTFSIASKAKVQRWDPVRPAIKGTRIYDEEFHRKAIVPQKARDCFTAIGSGPYKRAAR